MLSIQIKKLIYSAIHPHDSSDAAAPDSKGVKLHKIDVLTFDGNLLTWRSFLEQFCMSVHSRSVLADSKNLVYLRHSLKDGSAKHVIEGYPDLEYFMLKQLNVFNLAMIVHV